jgi:hypothetical protein
LNYFLDGNLMTNPQILDLLMLLSAIESWSFADKHRMPDYLYERIDTAIDLLREQLIGEEK